MTEEKRKAFIKFVEQLMEESNLYRDYSEERIKSMYPDAISFWEEIKSTVSH